MFRRRTVAIAAALAAAAFVPALPSHASGPAPFSGYDWPTYGGSAQHTFSVPTQLSPATVQTLVPKWFFPTGDSVTANPIKVGNRIYVGSWDGNFYAINDADGSEAWHYTVDVQHAVSPQVNEDITARASDITSDGGIITSSAWFERARDGRPDLLIFGGGFTLYAVRASDGSLYWKHVYPGTGVGGAENPDTDPTRIFTSPIVVGNHVLFGTTTDGERGLRGYVAAADVATGNPVWQFETDVDTNANIRNDGCGGVWSSLTYDPVDHLVVTATSDCHNRATEPYDEHVIALHEGGPEQDGTLAWSHVPSRVTNGDNSPCDWDFGATANFGVDNATGQNVITIGGKDGTVYQLDPTTGTERHATNLVFGGVAGGFIGSTAFDGNRVYGATSLGDIPAAVVAGIPGMCHGVEPRDNALQEPSIHAINTDGSVAWENVLAQSFGPTTVAGGMVFSAPTFNDQVQIRDAGTGLLLKTLPAPSGSASGIVVSNKSIYYGTGVFLPGPVVDGVYAWGAAL